MVTTRSFAHSYQSTWNWLYSPFQPSFDQMKLISLQPVYQPNMGDFKEPTALFKKSRGISPVLAACPMSDALITWIPADNEPLCRNTVYAIILIFIIIGTIRCGCASNNIGHKNRDILMFCSSGCSYCCHKECEMMVSWSVLVVLSHPHPTDCID